MSVDNLFSKKFQQLERRSPSPVPLGESPRLSRKAFTDLDNAEKTGVPLNSQWTLWLDRSVPNLTASEYEANLRKIYTVSTIESFWAVFNHIPTPSRLVPRYSYHMMRNDIRPVWEDEVNAKGGMWKLRCHKLCTDNVWNELLLACIGEQFSDYVSKDDDIIGLSVSIRKNDDLIQLWNINSTGAEECQVLKKIAEVLPYVTFETSFYKPHQEHRAFEGKKY
ncbi:eukaryotic translation initiation factor 4E type 3-like [Clavelina lepadiformis]|uniref:Eukaryotic translation initiation factor 4E type 3 n=1 Tax=Clavelina lepadiformis TaxID=159417 RepID=A0ABP0GIV6_CLALP